MAISATYIKPYKRSPKPVPCRVSVIKTDIGGKEPTIYILVSVGTKDGDVEYHRIKLLEEDRDNLIKMLG